MARYTMDELLAQRDTARANHISTRSIDLEIALRADEMADEVERVLSQPDERPYDWETDGE